MAFVGTTKRIPPLILSTVIYHICTTLSIVII